MIPTLVSVQWNHNSVTQPGQCSGTLEYLPHYSDTSQSVSNSRQHSDTHHSPVTHLSQSSVITVQLNTLHSTVEGPSSYTLTTVQGSPTVKPLRRLVTNHRRRTWAAWRVTAAREQVIRDCGAALVVGRTATVHRRCCWFYMDCW